MKVIPCRPLPLDHHEGTHSLHLIYVETTLNLQQVTKDPALCSSWHWYVVSWYVVSLSEPFCHKSDHFSIDCPSALTVNIHLQPITLFPGGSSTSSNVSFMYNSLISSWQLLCTWDLLDFLYSSRSVHTIKISSKCLERRIKSVLWNKIGDRMLSARQNTFSESYWHIKIRLWLINERIRFKLSYIF